jgi:hypothetical protein
MRNRVRWDPTQLREATVPLQSLTHNGELSIEQATKRYGWDSVLLSLSAQIEQENFRQQRIEPKAQLQPPRSPCAFISYRSTTKHAQLIAKIVDCLNNRGFKTLYDRDYVDQCHVQDQLPEFMSKLNHSTLFMQVMDQAYSDSATRPWIAYEREAALVQAVEHDLGACYELVA